MKVVDLQTRQEQVVVEMDGDNLGFVLTSHLNASTPERHVVCLHALGFEAAVDDESRGAAMLYLSELLKKLGYALARKAFEQEGDVKLPPVRKRG